MEDRSPSSPVKTESSVDYDEIMEGQKERISYLGALHDASMIELERVKTCADLTRDDDQDSDEENKDAPFEMARDNNDSSESLEMTNTTNFDTDIQTTRTFGGDEEDIALEKRNNQRNERNQTKNSQGLQGLQTRQKLMWIGNIRCYMHD